MIDQGEEESFANYESALAEGEEQAYLEAAGAQEEAENDVKNQEVMAERPPCKCGCGKILKGKKSQWMPGHSKALGPAGHYSRWHRLKRL